MANIANYLEEAILNHVLRNVEYVRPTTVYLGLVNDLAVAGDLEGGDLTNEIDGYIGNRKPITFDLPVQELGKATTKNNNGSGGGEIEFEDMPLTTVKFAIITDSATKGAGNILFWAELVPEKNVNAGDIFRVPVDNLTVDLD